MSLIFNENKKFNFVKQISLATVERFKNSVREKKGYILLYALFLFKKIMML
jgi:hypothetical protein